MKNISRRNLFKTVGLSSVFFALPKSLLASTRLPLVIPPLLNTNKGKPIFLKIGTTQKALNGQNYVEVWGFNGNYLGPTLKLNQSKIARINWQNTLPETVSIHIQGLQALAELGGNISRKLDSNESWSPVIPIIQGSSTCYYQSCTFPQSAYQNYRGLVGLCLIEGKEEVAKELPNEYGINDIPLILQDLSLNGDGVQLFTQEEPYFYGDRLFVNGQTSPYLNVASELIRLRILNASLSRRYTLSFNDNRNFSILAQDLGFLATPQSCNSIKLAPGERVEILVDLSNGKNTTLIADEEHDFFEKIGNIFSSQNLKDNVVLELRTKGLIAAFPEKKHFQFKNTIQNIKNKVKGERYFNLDPNKFTINGKRFNPRQLDVSVHKGSVERWKITTSSPMAFRIEGVQFVIEKEDGKLYPLELQAWKDTVWINESVDLLVYFTSYSSNKYPFTFGAADLTLVDRGCLALLVVK